MSLNSSTPSSRFDTNIRTHRRTTWLIVMIAGVVMQMTRAPAQVSDSNALVTDMLGSGRADRPLNWSGSARLPKWMRRKGHGVCLDIKSGD